MWTIDCVRIDDNLLCARDVVVEIVLAHAVVEIVLVHISEVMLTQESHKSIVLLIEGRTYHVDFLF